MDSFEFKPNICRICLDDEALLNWDEIMNETCGMTYKNCYLKHTDVQEIDGLPTNLCEICSEGLRNAQLLFEKALDSHEILQNKLASIQSNFNDEVDIVFSNRPIKNSIVFDFEDEDEYEEVSVSEGRTLIEIEFEQISENEINNIENEINNIEEILLEEETLESPHFIEMTTDELTTEDSLELVVNKNMKKKSTNKTVKKGKKKYMCSHCSLILCDVVSLKDHESRHNVNRQRSEMCPHCGVKFFTKKSLRTHLYIHDENREKKYNCEFCDKRFFNRGALNVHRRIHLGQVKKCLICMREFCRQIDLDRHLQTHEAVPNKPNIKKVNYIVKCKYCNKDVKSTKWKGHEAAHLEQPQVQCKICNRDFYSRTNCTTHLNKIHHKTKEEYDDCIYYYSYDSKIRLNHVWLEQREEVQIVKEIDTETEEN